MKLCAVQGIVAIAFCGLAIAHTNFAQVLDRKITLSMQQASFEDALKKIETVASVRFFYSLDQLEVDEKISFEAQQRSLRDVLDEILGPRKIIYKVYEKKSVILLKRKTMSNENRSVSPGGYIPVLPQIPARAISGTVTDATTSLPLPGVNILVKGSTKGTTTNSDGKFLIEVDNRETLVFSFIGFKTVEILVDERSVIDITMEADVTALREIEVNAGYWTVKKQEQTGSIVRVSGDDIKKQPVQNPLAALQGRVAGLEITQLTGVPGGNFRIRIRGTNSIANGNDPLFIVDGVPYTSESMTFSETSGQILGYGTSPLNNINPADIESIEVLKDADATAIYGSRGSNGVILITTKKGQAGKTKVDVNFYSGIGQVARNLDLLNTQQYITMRKEAFANDGVTPTMSNARDLLVWDTTRYTDWQNELIGGTANTTDMQFAISGGEKNTQFSVGVGYHKETTVLPGNNSDRRVSTHISISNTSPNQKLRTHAKVTYTASNSDLINKDLTGVASYLPPNAPALYDESGELNWLGWDTQSTYENPLAFLKRRHETRATNMIASAELSYLILPTLQIKSRIGYTSIRMDAFNLVPLSSLAPARASTSFNTTILSNSTFNNWMVEPQASWKPQLGNGQFDILVGTQFLDQTKEGLEQTASGFTSEALMKNIASAASRSILGTNYFSQYRYHAIFGRINYTYNSKYILNVTGRRDGSSRFGPGNQFANFGAVGAAWIFSDEGLIKNAIGFLSFGKIRASYGITGNDQLSDYQYLDAYSSSPDTYQGVVGLAPVRLSNPDFAWETNNKLEAALDLGFAEGNIFTSVSLYQNRSSNQLVGNPLPPSAGFTAIQANFPATVENSGIEIELNTTNVRRKEFTWTTFLNVSVSKNELITFPDLALFPAYADRYVIGEPLTINKTYNFQGVDPVTGLYQFEDVDGNGSFNNADRQTIKFIGPKFYGGLQNSLNYKGFELDILFQFAKQEGRNFLSGTSTPGFMFNQPKHVLARWQREGDATDVQRFGRNSQTSSPYGRLQASDRSISDASFIRLKNVSVSYGLPSAWTDKIRLSSARIFIQGQNLLTITRYSGLDPESQSYALPPLRILTAGASLSF